VYLLDGAFVLVVADLVADPERSREEDQDSGEEVLEDVLECKPDREASDSQRADQVRRIKSGESSGDSDERTDDNDKSLDDSPHCHPERAVFGLHSSSTPHDRLHYAAHEVEKNRD